jgi:hypothetical protein
MNSSFFLYIASHTIILLYFIFINVIYHLNMTLSILNERPPINILRTCIIFISWILLLSYQFFFIIKDFIDLCFGKLRIWILLIEMFRP